MEKPWPQLTGPHQLPELAHTQAEERPGNAVDKLNFFAVQEPSHCVSHLLFSDAVLLAADESVVVKVICSWA